MEYKPRKATDTPVHSAVAVGGPILDESKCLTDCVYVPPAFYPRLPTGAFCYYREASPSAGKDAALAGAFLKKYIEGPPAKFLFESIPRGYTGMPGYRKYTVDESEIEKLWKRYPATDAIELMMIATGMSQLKSRLVKLEKNMAEMQLSRGRN